MTAQVALLRGINVGGAHRLTMADLRAALSDAGAIETETYVQSGNAVFDGQVKFNVALDAIEARAGFRPHLLLISGGMFLDIVAANPFREATKDPKALHIFFFPAGLMPDPAELAVAKSSDETFLLTDKALYLYTPRYLSGSKLAPKIDRLLGVKTTARNWRTAVAIRDMLERRG